MRFRIILACASLCVMLLAICQAGVAVAQNADANVVYAHKRVGAGAPRKLAPGVMIAIPPEVEESETFSGPREMVEVVHGIPNLDWTPNYLPKSETLLEMAKRVTFRRKVWCLEFAFKPVRMIEVDVPQADGVMLRKKIWYLVYRVRNTGYHLNPAEKEDEYGHKVYEPSNENYSVRFFPTFVLESHSLKKAYLDRLVPVAQQRVQQREDPNIRIFNSVQVSQIDIPVSTDRIDKSVWGVATWEDIDPRTDFFSIYIQGLTNAYRFEDPPGAYKQGDPPGTGRRYAWKTLKLNFWRPGDEFDEEESEIRFGIPDQVEYEWVWR